MENFSDAQVWENFCIYRERASELRRLLDLREFRKLLLQDAQVNSDMSEIAYHTAGVRSLDQEIAAIKHDLVEALKLL